MDGTEASADSRTEEAAALEAAAAAKLRLEHPSVASFLEVAPSLTSEELARHAARLYGQNGQYTIQSALGLWVSVDYSLKHLVAAERARAERDIVFADTMKAFCDRLDANTAAYEALQKRLDDMHDGMLAGALWLREEYGEIRGAVTGFLEMIKNSPAGAMLGGGGGLPGGMPDMKALAKMAEELERDGKGEGEGGGGTGKTD